MAKQATTGLIYGYLDPRTNELRYVGKIERYGPTVKRRLINRHKVHLWYARAKRSTFCHNWIQSLLSQGIEPVMILLEEVPIATTTEAERFNIAYWKSLGSKLTNLTEGGEGMPGRKPSAETREKMAAGHRGKVFRVEHRKRISIAKRGVKRRPHSAETRAKIANRNRGKRHREETKRKLSLIRLGSKASSETRRILSEAQRRRYSRANPE